MNHELDSGIPDDLSGGYVTHRHEIVFSRVLPDGAEVPVDCELMYDTSDPFAVKLRFLRDSAIEVEWLVSRELLAAGLLTPSGEGDVRIGPDLTGAKRVMMMLNTPAGTATFAVRLGELVEFLDCSHALVSAGEEWRWFDFDRELEWLAPVRETDEDGV
ncbi:SsgA family sporulation/cell division regulator [Amycolatopsis sp. WAC 04197]|uniref:SsgA family sporulation/cell division regulator n=1 Tax=Amycolatopsis sp. WAC 04197 TaxID=2203199 RepID=UPI000F7B0CEB|nr:SsgA family sporulation/cell division regulator [Amycolatopsis sp. WAC 04197]RSN39906.1 SsgA family sporulation/cell division regulator [Amycolatopsis sp. WAC 04197]